MTDDGEPIKKTRFVDDAFTRKLFEVYSKPRLELAQESRNLFDRKLSDAIDVADVVVVLDFGHGLMDLFERCLTVDAKFLAVNAQTNAGNHGFNPVTKYSRANLVCIDLPEARLAARMQNESDPMELATEIYQETTFEHLIITRGRDGAFANNRPVPSFSNGVTDTIGAGDAFLAVAAPLVAAGLDLEQAAFCGNVAGAIKTDIVGHRRHVTREELMDRIGELLG